MKLEDEAVIVAILRVLTGEPASEVAGDLGVTRTVVTNWCEGVNRRKCSIEAERRYRESLK